MGLKKINKEYHKFISSSLNLDFVSKKSKFGIIYTLYSVKLNSIEVGFAENDKILQNKVLQSNTILLDKKRGILFWITGLSGAGKTSISNTIYKILKNKYGKTLYVNGDEMRKILDLKSYKNLDRKKGAIKYSKLFKKITDQNINVLFAGMALFDEVRLWNRKYIKNYLEIYIKTDIKNIIKKKIY